jgi:hypothetical protein
LTDTEKEEEELQKEQGRQHELHKLYDRLSLYESAGGEGGSATPAPPGVIGSTLRKTTGGFEGSAEDFTKQHTASNEGLHIIN